MREYIKTADNSKHCILVDGLSKAYEHDNFRVKNVSFKSDINECLVILGTNGAGKSSLFKCLTGETVPNHGNVTIAGIDLYNDKYNARKLLG